MNIKNLRWAIIVIVGALINVGVNYGYKVATGDLSLEWLAANVMFVASVTLFAYAFMTKRAGWKALGQGKMPLAVFGIGLMVAGCFVCFLLALSTGPLSLVDPLWICIYSLTSLLIGICLIKERPSAKAIVGIGLYLFGAGFMGLTQYKGGNYQNIWLAYTVIGAIANGFINYGYKTYAIKIDMFILIGAIYLITALGLMVYGIGHNPHGWMGLLNSKVIATLLTMGVFQSVWVILMITALLKGPLSLVDPLWACIYSLASVLMGMAAVHETPSTVALSGVGLYLVGTYLMSRDKRSPS